MMQSMKWLYVVLCFFRGIAGFNVDTDYPIVFRGSKDSYFGYSVGIVRSGKESMYVKDTPVFIKRNERVTAGNLGMADLSSNRALVAAPRANNSVLFRYGIDQPGVLHKCSVKSKRCEEMAVDGTKDERIDTRNRYTYRDRYYRPLKDDMWLGVSMDTRDPANGDNVQYSAVVCGHLWKHFKDYSENKFRPTGNCYLIPKNLEEKDIKAVVPLLRLPYFQKDPLYTEFAEAGMSVTFAENGRQIGMGTPGYYGWQGSAIRAFTFKSDVPVTAYPSYFPDYSYLGYSITSGKFYNRERSEAYFAAGAPKDNDYQGSVITFSDSSRTKIVVIQRLRGIQLGEYFGASVLGIDLNGDGNTDLLVGAPQHSLSSGGDEGKVYVYMSDGQRLILSHISIMGDSIMDARFGTSIANVGDINQDGFQDAAIGAPYEEDGQGAIYIYHGDTGGLRTKYAQKIPGKSLKSQFPLKGFGISIATGRDVDSNGYPDLLIGAYTSDQAVLLRTHAVVRVTPYLKSSVKQINLDAKCDTGGEAVPCFDIFSCLVYEGASAPKQLNFTIDIDVERSRSHENYQPRAYFLSDGPGSSRIMQVKDKKMLANVSRENCLSHRVYLTERIDDYSEPVTFTMSYTMEDNRKKHGKFCKTCPVLDETSSTRFATFDIDFLKDCGDDNKCESELQIIAHIEHQKRFIQGEINEFTLIAIAENLGEPAYQPRLVISIPREMSVVNSGGCETEKPTEFRQRNLVFICKLNNPLKQYQSDEIQMKLEFPGRLTDSAKDFVITVNGTTHSIDRSDNANKSVELREKLEVVADVTIYGVSLTPEALFDAHTEDIDVTHFYEIAKYHSSSIHTVELEIRWPYKFLESGVRFAEIKTENKTGEVPIRSCKIFDDDPVRSLWEDVETKSTPENTTLQSVQASESTTLSSFQETKKASTTTAPLFHGRSVSDNASIPVTTHSPTFAKRMFLDCTVAECLRIICDLGPFFKSNERTKINITLKVDVNLLAANWKNIESFYVVSEGRVSIQDEGFQGQPPGNLPDFTQVNSLLVSITAIKRTLPPWIMSVSVGGGLLLLLLVAAALLKVGFFRRSKRKELQQLKRQTPLQAQENQDESCPGTKVEELENMAFDGTEE